MATAIVSLVTGRTVSDEVGMTGEITLTGQVLQIGGVREKVLAAQRAGLKKVILPHENEADLSELPDETREEIEFVLAETIRRGARGSTRERPRLPGRTRQRSDRRLWSVTQRGMARPRPRAARLAKPEAGRELRAGVGLAVRLAPAAGELVAPPPAQHEGDQVDEVAVGDPYSRAFRPATSSVRGARSRCP